MDSPPADFQSDLERYLTHVDGLRSLALALVGDPAEADDLVQEVWLLSQRLRASSPGRARQWLAGLLRNLVRDRRRARATRALHEERAALERALSEHEHPLTREAAIHQVVAGLVVQLPEPYRGTLLARYYEELSPPEIAERDDIPLATVKTRLRRGLALLREQLSERESRGTNALVALAFCTWPRELPAPAAELGPVLEVGRGFSVAFGVLGVAALVTVAALVISERPHAPALELGERRASQVRQDGAPSSASASLDPARRPVVADTKTEVASVTSPTAAAELLTATVTVVDLVGRPVAGARVRCVERTGVEFGERGAWAVTDESGRAELEQPSAAATVECEREGWLTFGRPVFDPGSPRSATAVLAPALALRGRVLDERGRGVSGARVEAGLVGSYAARIGRPLDRTAFETFTARTDGEGAFELTVPDDGGRLGVRVDRVGFHVLRRELLELRADVEVSLPLQPITDSSILFGRVVDAGRSPLEGAWVSDGTEIVRTGAQGEFQLNRSAASSEVLVGAVGCRPKRLARTGMRSPVTLVLDEPELSIRGRVVDAEGRGLEGWRVRPRNAWPAGAHAFAWRGRTARIQLSLEAFAQPPGIEGVPGHAVTSTAADGSFLLGGLLAQPYELDVYDPLTLSRPPAQVVSSGASGVSFVVDPAPPALRGRVVRSDGEPIAGAVVRSFLPSSRSAGPPEDIGPAARTDEDGRFAFSSLARGVHVVVPAGDGWLHLSQVVDADRMELVLEPAARVQLVVQAARGAIVSERIPTGFLFRDSGGRPVRHAVADLRWSETNAGTLGSSVDGGRFRPLPVRVPIRAVELVLTDAEGPLLEVPLQLEAGASFTLEY